MTLILIEKDPFVALDLSQIVARLLPHVEIAHFSSLFDVESGRQESGQADYLIFRTSSNRDDARASLSAAQRFARSVLAITDSLHREDWDAGDVVLVPQPFTESGLRDGMLRWTSSSPQPQR
ncbi:hypothetical protein R5H30_18060 [Sulfitobacter sp. D35]|uniref:hypothetical protein n=1 Tax=Sulfitobacter sp. D35 TaxID=3083252 RepID=UPI00296F1CB6|nr:hypothetical protein [Sulfitobacter sp. D35]MDW4499904.1 hypothetical protein [Sulfitobacter sp. D35]